MGVYLAGAFLLASQHPFHYIGMISACKAQFGMPSKKLEVTSVFPSSLTVLSSLPLIVSISPSLLSHLFAYGPGYNRMRRKLMKHVRQIVEVGLSLSGLDATLIRKW